jgi:hypothetical protein
LTIGDDQSDVYLIEIGEMIRLRKETARELITGIEKVNSNKRIVVGISGHK